MAEQEKKVILTVDTGSSEKTVKSLKKDISDLKDAILNLEKGTEEYDSAVEQLQASQRELNEVQALTKKSAVALEGSYDALTHQMSLLKKEWRATADEARRADLGKQIDEINQQLKKMDASVGNFQRNVGNYVSHWEGMPDVIDEVSNSTMTFQQRMSEMNQSLEPTKQGFEAVSQLASGMASGFAAVQGAMALLGKENENLEQTFIKLQAAMALAQGIGGMKGLVEGAGKAAVELKDLSVRAAAAGGGIKGLMKVMGKSGWIAIILAVVAALTALIKNLPIVKQRNADWEAQIRSTVDAQNQLYESIEKNNKKLEERIDILRAQGVEERSLLETQLAQAKVNEEKASQQFSQAAKKLVQVNADADRKTGMDRGAFKQKYNGMSPKEAKEHYQQLRDEALEHHKEMIAIREGYEHQIRVLDEQQKTAFGKRLKQMEESLKSEEQRLKEQYERDLADAEKYGYDKLVIEKKYQEDLKKLRERYKTTTTTTTTTTGTTTGTTTYDKTVIQEKVRLEKEASDRKLKLLEIEKVKEQAIAYETIIDKEKLAERLEEIDREYAGKEYDIELKLQEDILALWKTELETLEEGSQERIDLAEDIANKEIEIELYKQKRIKEINKQTNSDSQKTPTTPTGTTTTTTTTTTTGGTSNTPMTDAYRSKIEEADTFKEYWDVFKESFADFDDMWAEMNFEQKTQTITDLANVTLGNTSQIINSLADMYEQDGELSEKEMKKIKNLRIASATIDMLNGAVTAFASAMSLGVPLGPIVGAANAAAVLTMGGINIAKIKSTKVDGSTTSTGGASAIPNVSSYSSELPVNFTRNVTTASEVDELNKSTKVYVLESDIADAMTKVSVRSSEASF